MEVIDLCSSGDLDDLAPHPLPLLTYSQAQAPPASHVPHHAIKSEPDSQPSQPPLQPSNTWLSTNGTNGVSQPGAIKSALLGTKAKTGPGRHQRSETITRKGQEVCQLGPSDSIQPATKARSSATPPSLAPSGLRKPLPVRIKDAWPTPCPRQLQPKPTQAQLHGSQQQPAGPQDSSHTAGVVPKPASTKRHSVTTASKRGPEGAPQQPGKRSKHQVACIDQPRQTAKPTQQQTSVTETTSEEAAVARPGAAAKATTAAAAAAAVAAVHPKATWPCQQQQQHLIKQEADHPVLVPATAAAATAVEPRVSRVPAVAEAHAPMLARFPALAAAPANQLLMPHMGTSALCQSAAGEPDDLPPQMLQQFETGACLDAAGKRGAIANLISAVADNRSVMPCGSCNF